MEDERSRAAVTYNSYLKLDELLSLQQPRSEGPEHDETLFIVIHQVYELWFKELLHELDRVSALLEQDDLSTLWSFGPSALSARSGRSSG
jgi:tryptophan 2,3-dioxygenase